MFHQYNRLLKLCLTVPMTTATAERSFSVMNRMKTCLRSTMTQIYKDTHVVYWF